LWNKLPVFLVLVVSLSAIYSSIAYYATSKPPSQPFIEFGLYSTRGLQGYIPAQNSTITPPQTTNWTITVANMMSTAQDVLVVVRLGNSTTQSPNSTIPTATVPELTAIRTFLGIGETSRLNFSWTITSTNQTGALVFPNLVINGEPITGQLQVGATSGQNFRLIFELWTYDTSTASFQYGYPGTTGNVGEWLQVWFNVAS
jgi:hypothetical protein